MARKSLSDPDCRQEIIRRITALQPGSVRQWRKMSAHQALCHLSDSYRSVIGERSLSSAPKSAIPQPVMKWLALKAPMKWPKGVPTRPENEQGKGGTPPTDFEHDRAMLLESLDCFCRAEDALLGTNPILGPMTRKEWMRWGYLHADHHLRQFSV